MFKSFKTKDVTRTDRLERLCSKRFLALVLVSEVINNGSSGPVPWRKALSFLSFIF